MITASKEFKEKLKKGANVVNYADITLSNGEVLHLTYKDFMIGGCSIEDKTTDGKFGVGFAVGKTLSIKIANHDERFSKYDFYNSIIQVYVAIPLDNGTIEKIRKGVYYATVPSTSGEVIEINAVDGMFLLDKDYASSRTSYPATLQTILTNACLDCGIPIGFRQFGNMSFVVKEKPESVTYRQIVSYVCQISGYNARIDNDGYMQLIWYNSALLGQYNYVGGDFKEYPHDVVIDGGDFTDYSASKIFSGGEFTDEMPEHIFRTKSLDVHTDDVQITGVRVMGKEDKSALFGEDGYLIEVKNPFADGKEQEVADYLGRRMVGMMFRPFTAQVLNNPLYEPFDVVRVSDQKGNVYVSILNSVSYKVGGYTQVACIAEDPARNGSMYYSEAAAAVVEARRNAEKQITEYDKAVQQMNQLAGNALGYHTTYEEQPDGSRITYLHDKPNLSDSKTVYKQTIDGFFISTDGGRTYTSGFDKNGNAVVNILYAIGIVADWIRGGTLTLGGDSNIDGSCVIYDANKNEIGRFDKDGIATNSAKITGGYIDIYTEDEEKSQIILRGKIGEKPCHLSLRPYEIVNIIKDEETGNASSSSITTSHIHLSSPTFNASYTSSGLFISGKEKIASSLDYSSLSIGNTQTGIKLTSGNNSVICGWHFNNGIFNNNSVGVSFSIVSAIFKKQLTLEDELYLKSGVDISMNSGRIFNPYGDLSINRIFGKQLSVTGQKNRIVKTINYSDRLLYCYETTKPYFGDIGEASLDENGVCYIFIDDIFYETINTDCQYQVFLQKYGQGDVWVEERKQNYFLIKGTPNLRFGWELKARQLGFEVERMEKFVQEKPEETIDYEKEAEKYIKEYYREVLNYEESN